MPLIDEADIKSSCIIFLALAYQHFSLEGVIKFDLLEGWTVTMDLDGSPQAPPSAIRSTLPAPARRWGYATGGPTFRHLLTSIKNFQQEGPKHRREPRRW